MDCSMISADRVGATHGSLGALRPTNRSVGRGRSQFSADLAEFSAIAQREPDLGPAHAAEKSLGPFVQAPSRLSASSWLVRFISKRLGSSFQFGDSSALTIVSWAIRDRMKLRAWPSVRKNGGERVAVAPPG
jgi:hypothetical protein